MKLDGRSLSILFTNNTLSSRAGSELWVRDVCRALVGRGHRPVAFSLHLGAVAEDLRAATVPVVSTLADVGITPDVIHGHHHLETLIAALHFPGVPIVNFCHGFYPWEEAPLHHPSIARYVAVDAPSFDRLTAADGIAPDRVDQLPNFVDLRRFTPRGPLPPRPKRALVLSNYAEPGGYIEIIREACREGGIELEIAGASMNRVIDRPEDLMAGADIVFAKARTALEAMAVGCAVVVTDVFGSAPLVTLRQFDEMRSCNFGIRLLHEPHSVDWYRSQIAVYDADEAARVSARVREVAGLDLAVDHLLGIYERALTDAARGAPPADGGLEAQRAAARHLEWAATRFKRGYGFERTAQALSAELSAASSLSASLAAERDRLRDHARDQATEQAAERRILDGTVQSLSTELTEARRLNEALVAERERLRDHARDQATEQAGKRRILDGAVQSLSNDLTAARRLNEALVEERDRLRLLVADYRGLSVIRVRDAVVRLPVLGGIARRAARWLR